MLRIAIAFKSLIADTVTGAVVNTFTLRAVLAEITLLTLALEVFIALAVA